MGPEIERGLKQFAVVNDLDIEMLRRQVMGPLCKDFLVDSNIITKR